MMGTTKTISPAVGDEYELKLPPISRTTLALFAGGSGDHNPIHVDIDAARSAGLPDVIAHGMLSAAYVARLLTENFGLSRLRKLDVRFTSMTPVGAAPKCTALVREVGGQQAVVELEVALDDGTTTIVGSAAIDLKP